ncbi:hypothetical protein JCM10908_007381 [Rhodotorula pacifica]|uniref:LIM domain-containing protein n=1 Tax=Rhodotorula pacifica TaxID=1495444 RepID=UPI00316BF041
MPPRVFGGSPTCPTCGKAVYFAEKVIGPGGTLYHKLCLKCNECQKSLEPRLLVDHDGVAYCKACYGKLFGAKGYGAGGALVGEYAPRATPPSSPQKGPPTPARPTPSFPSNNSSSNATLPSSPSFASSSSATQPARAVPPPPPAAPTTTTAPPAPVVVSTAARRPLPTPPVPAPKPPSIPARPSFGGTAPAPSIPVLVPREEPNPAPSTPQSASEPARRDDTNGSGARPSAPDFDEEDLRSLTISSSSLPPAPPTSASNPLLSRDLCPRCHTVVYHAESISALSRKWHKRCLRCAGCGTSLMPNRLEERDGEPWCRKCYTDKFGLKGGMGVMTRPNLF